MLRSSEDNAHTHVRLQVFKPSYDVTGAYKSLDEDDVRRRKAGHNINRLPDEKRRASAPPGTQDPFTWQEKAPKRKTNADYKDSAQRGMSSNNWYGWGQF